MINHPASKAHNYSVEGPRKLKFGYGLHEGQRLLVRTVNAVCLVKWMQYIETRKLDPINKY